MKTITSKLMNQIIDAQGALDTSDYRYIAIDKCTAKRMPIGFVGTTAAIGYAWEIITVKNQNAEI